MGYILGVDGGGSGTLAVVTDLSGRITGRARSGPSNIHAVSEEESLEALMTSVASALSKAGLPVSGGQDMHELLKEAGVSQACFGLAGAGREEDRAIYRRMLCEAGLILTDSEIALDAATRGGPGVLLISGTGSACLGRTTAGELIRAGGYGHIIGDEGSGYHMGKEALAACLRHHDGRGPATTLTERLSRATGLKHISDIPSLLRDSLGRPEIAALSEIVLDEAYNANDPVAWAIVRRAQLDLCEMATAVYDRTGGTITLSGGVFGNSEVFSGDIAHRLLSMRPSATTRILELPPVAGAVWRAARQAGVIDLDLSSFDHMERSRTALPARKTETLDAGLPVTEARNPRSLRLGSMDASEIAGLMNQEDSVIPVAIRGCLHEISEVMGWAAESLRTGGRLVYAGAGTSGRLGVLDASECPPTFGVNPDRVIGVQAGGMEALFRSIEGAEDDADAGAAKMDELGISSRDTVVGIAASGGTRFTLGALARARELGAKTAALVSNPGSPMTRTAEVTICPVVGPEVLTGSTRLKSGTSHKMVLNMISTGAMALTGKVYENLMVDVVASNQKLRERAVRIVARGARVEEERAGAALSESGMEIKTALVMLIASVGPEDARRALSDGNSNVAAALLRFRRD